MNISGVVLGFQMTPGESLKGLVETCGYSKPTAANRVASKGSTLVADSIEVERQGDMAYVTIKVTDLYSFEDALSEAWYDLEEAGLIVIPETD